MTNEFTTLIDGIKAQLEGSSFLSYVKKFHKYGYELDLCEAGHFPWVNVKFSDDSLITTEADNQRRYDYERHLYSVIITFAVRAKTSSMAIEGNATTPGVWDMYEDLKSSIGLDFTFGGLAENLPFNPEVYTGVIRHDDGRFWIGQGALNWKQYKDFCLR